MCSAEFDDVVEPCDVYLGREGGREGGGREGGRGEGGREGRRGGGEEGGRPWRILLKLPHIYFSILLCSHKLPILLFFVPIFLSNMPIFLNIKTMFFAT